MPWPSELKFSNGSTRQAIRSTIGDTTFLNNFFNRFFIKNQPWHKWFKSNYLTLCHGLFLKTFFVGKLFKYLCLSRILSLLSRDVGWNLVSPTLESLPNGYTATVWSPESESKNDLPRGFVRSRSIAFELSTPTGNRSCEHRDVWVVFIGRQPVSKSNI